jgi:hypothetical protein
MLSFITVLSLLLSFLGTTSADIFTATASLPGSTLDGLPVNAAGQAFWLGGSPASYCPPEVPQCPNTTETIVVNGFTELDVSKFCPSIMLGIDPVHRSRFLAARESTLMSTALWDLLKPTPITSQLAQSLAISLI